MNLNNLLRGKNVDPEQVLMLRHRPHEPQLNKVLPWLAAGRPDVFNAYQQTQGGKLERTMQAMVDGDHQFGRNIYGDASSAKGGCNRLQATCQWLQTGCPGPPIAGRADSWKPEVECRHSHIVAMAGVPD